MKHLFTGLCGLALIGLPGTGRTAPVPAGAELTISFDYKDNNNKLRNKTTAANYTVLEDGYAATIWIEGPYNPGTPCEIINYERQNIKLAKIITYFSPAHTRDGLTAKPNTWPFHDYNTADFMAAVITAGMYTHFLPSEWPWSEGQTTTNTTPAPVAVQRRDRTTGGIYCHTSNSVICLAPSNSHMGDITTLPDGISGATVYPDAPARTYTWDMTDLNGDPVEEGYYLVYVLMSAERFPRTMEGGELVGGKEMIELETCWDDSYYDDKGHHRVVRLYHFSDTGFTEQVAQETKWSGDQYDYMDGPMTFSYSVPSGIDAPAYGPARALLTCMPSVAPAGTYVTLNDGPDAFYGTHRAVLQPADGSRAVSLGVQGGRVRLPETLSPGVYMLRIERPATAYTARIVVIN